jgi:ankyrin repeat protein
MKRTFLFLLLVISALGLNRALAGDGPDLAAFIRNNDYESFVKSVEAGGTNAALTRECATLLALACQEGRVKFVKYLVDRGCNVEDDNNHYRVRPLHAAASTGTLEIVEYLVEKGARVNARDITDLTPLHYAACSGSREVVSYLIKKGADVKAKTEDGITPLFQACKCEELTVMQTLIKADRDHDANAPDKCGWSLLHQAAKENNDKAVAYLLEMGAKVNARTSAVKYYGSDDTITRGVAPLHCAASRSNNTMVIRLLIKNGVDVNMADANGWTPLHYAVVAKDADALKLLLNSHADAGKKTGKPDKESGELYTRIPSGLTPLALAEFLARENGEYQAIVNVLSSGKSKK